MPVECATPCLRTGKFASDTDCFVLASNMAKAACIRAALEAAGSPCVLTGRAGHARWYPALHASVCPAVLCGSISQPSAHGSRSKDEVLAKRRAHVAQKLTWCLIRAARKGVVCVSVCHGTGCIANASSSEQGCAVHAFYITFCAASQVVACWVAGAPRARPRVAPAHLCGRRRRARRHQEQQGQDHEAAAARQVAERLPRGRPSAAECSFC